MAQSRLRNFFARLGRWLKWLALGWVIFSVGTVLLMRWVDPWTSAFMLRDRTIALFSNDSSYRFAHQWADWRNISPNAKLAVIASEDQKFAEHWGFDLSAMQSAWQRNQRSRKIRGASTLTQQVAKNLYLWPQRSYVRKALEAWFTALIELCWPKQRILEVYLNSAEFGKGVFGVEAASRRYFGKPAARLSAAEAALLAAVLPAPKRLQVARPSAYVRARQAWIMRQMGQLGGRQYLAQL